MKCLKNTGVIAFNKPTTLLIEKIGVINGTTYHSNL